MSNTSNETTTTPFYELKKLIIEHIESCSFILLGAALIMVSAYLATHAALLNAAIIAPIGIGMLIVGESLFLQEKKVEMTAATMIQKTWRGYNDKDAKFYRAARAFEKEVEKQLNKQLKNK